MYVKYVHISKLSKPPSWFTVWKIACLTPFKHVKQDKPKTPVEVASEASRLANELESGGTPQGAAEIPETQSKVHCLQTTPWFMLKLSLT